MLDPAAPQKLDLTDFSTYLASCLELASKRLADYPDLAAVKADEDEINRYVRLQSLAEPRGIEVLGPDTLSDAELGAAAEALLHGRVLLEHTCAGEATRLGLGTKYTINPKRDLTPEVMARLLPNGAGEIAPGDLKPLSLGRRHMLQLAWDLSQLAEQAGTAPKQVLARQRLLVIINQATGDQVVDDFSEAKFYGFDPARVMFMVQESFHGIDKQGEAWVYDESSPRRLHNHGQMLMQTAMDRQLFTVGADGDRHHLGWSDYHALLTTMADKISFNIEDLDYLDMSLDLPGLAMALKQGELGAKMVMEVVANNPDNPQKGGACFWDPHLGSNVIVESFQLAGLPNERITHLNKNINHYPDPAKAVSAALQPGLSMPIAVKGDRLYFQPIQGDLNFLLPTVFVRRSELRPIQAWKSAEHTPLALAAMARQDARPGFLAWAGELMGPAL